MEEAKRNQRGRLVIDKNKTTDALIPVRVLDERFLMQDFTYVVDVNFRSLKGAVTAQEYVLSVLDLINGGQINEVNIENTLNLTEIPTVDTFLSDIGNLINNDSENPVAQRFLINKLEQEVENLKTESLLKNEEIYQQTENLINANLLIGEKDSQINELTTTINSLIDNLSNE